MEIPIVPLFTRSGAAGKNSPGGPNITDLLIAERNRMSGSDGVLPIARFSPAPGLVVDRTEKSVRISGAMELYGPEATAARAQSIQQSINTTWTATFPDGYAVSCDINVRYRDASSKAGDATQIEAVKISGPSHVTDMPVSTAP